jgi:hypothetical protein
LKKTTTWKYSLKIKDQIDSMELVGEIRTLFPPNKLHPHRESPAESRGGVIVASRERFISQLRGTCDKAKNAFPISFSGRGGLEYKVAKRYSPGTRAYQWTIKQ